MNQDVLLAVSNFQKAKSKILKFSEQEMSAFLSDLVKLLSDENSYEKYHINGEEIGRMAANLEEYYLGLFFDKLDQTQNNVASDFLVDSDFQKALNEERKLRKELQIIPNEEELEKIAEELNIYYCKDKSFCGDFSSKVFFVTTKDITPGVKYIQCSFAYTSNEFSIYVKSPHFNYNRISDLIGEKLRDLITDNAKNNPSFRVKVATGQYKISKV